MAVKFTRTYQGRYHKDDVAVFSAAKESQLIRERYAVKHGTEEPPKRNPEQPQDRQTTVGPQKRK